MSLLTIEQRTNLQRAIKKVEKCNGDCKQCKNLLMPVGGKGNNIYYAFVCGIADAAGYTPMANEISELKARTLECFKFELS